MNRYLNKKVAKYTYDFSTLPSATFASTALNSTADTITLSNHPFKTGDLVSVILVTGTALPTVPAVSTAYYVIYVDKDTIKLASSEANAYAGTALTTIAAGSQDGNCKLVKNCFGSVKSGLRIPSGSVITNCTYNVLTTFTSSDGTNTDAATIGLGVETVTASSEDLKAAIAISDATNVWDAGLHGTLAGIPALDGNARTAIAGAAAISGAFIKTTDNKELTMNIAVDPVTAGKMDVYIEYIG